ncbi:MAG: kelch repeat-containing protein [bacterium]
MSIKPAPGVEGDGERAESSVVIVDEEGKERDYMNRSDYKVKLRLEDAVSFEKVHIANREEFLKGEKGKSYEKEELEKIKDSESTYEIKELWDLSEGLYEDELEISPELKVYALMENEYGATLLLMTSIAIDDRSPELELSLNPAYTNGSRPISLNISSEELIRYESLDIRTSESVLLFVCPDASEGDLSLSFTCTASPTGDSLAEGEYEIEVSASDRAGNIGENSIFLFIETTPPEIEKSELKVSGDKERRYVISEEEIEVVFEVVDDISNYKVRIGLIEVDNCKKENIDEISRYTCSYTSKPEDSEGTKDVTVELKDLAGNGASYAIGQLIFDMRAPELISSLVIPSQINRSSSGFNILLNFSEEVAITDISMFPELALDCGDLTEYRTQYDCSYTFGAGDESLVNDYVLSHIEYNDRAGNVSDSHDVETVKIDREHPYVTSQTPDPLNQSVKYGQEFSFSFTVNEKLLGDPVVKIGDRQLTDSACENITGTNEYQCTHSPEAEESDGEKQVTVNLRDEFNNISLVTLNGHINYDVTPPELLNPVIIPDGTANRYNNTVQVRFSFTEQVKDGEDFIFTAKNSGGTDIDGFTCTTNNNQSFVCEKAFNINDETEDEYFFHVYAEDLVGNPVKDGAPSVEVGSLKVDRKNPEAESLTVVTDPASNPLRVNSQTETVTVTFTANEALSDDPVVTLGNLSLDAPHSSTGLNYSYIFDDLAGLTDGDRTVTVTLVDAAGNQNTAVHTETILVDRTAPVLTITTNKDLYNANDVVVITVAASEELDGDPSVTLNDTPIVHQSKQGNSWTYRPSLIHGENTIRAIGTDIAGNISEEAVKTYHVDTVIPTATLSSPYPPQIPEDGTSEVTVSGINKPLADIRLNGKKDSCEPDGEGYICTFTPEPGISEDSIVPVSISLTDNAGNTNVLTAGTVFVDRTAPTITVTLNGTDYNASDTILISVDSSEKLADEPAVKIEEALSLSNPEKISDFSWLYTVDPNDLSDGETYTVIAEATDLAGHTGSDFKQFSVDLYPPELDGTPVIDPERVSVSGANSTYTVTFTTSENMSEGTVVVKRQSQTLSCSPGDNINFDFVCNGSGYAGDGDSIDPITITLTDKAGNSATYSAGNIYIDRTPPAVAGNATILLSSPENCPLSSVSRITNGSDIQVSFIVTEELGANPTVRAVNGDDETTLSLHENTGLFYIYKADDVVTPADGQYNLQIILGDTVANTNTHTQTNVFGVKTTNPATPSVNVPDHIVYRRIPWGSDETGGIKSYRIRAKDGETVVDGDTTTVIVYDGPDPETDSEIGRRTVSGGTFSEFELNRSDRKDVYIAAYDNACNRSDVVRVRDVEWTATMGYKVPGSNFENPHEFISGKSFNKALYQGYNIEENLPDGTMNFSESYFEQMNPGANDLPLFGAAMAYDSKRGEIVLFGGQTQGSFVFFNDTWVFNGRWEKRNPTTKPSKRSGHTMVYDSKKDRILLFGGFAPGGGESWDCFDDTWEWDGDNWIKLNPETTPPARGVHSMVYSPLTNKTLIFGGAEFVVDEFVNKNDMWEWDGVNWTEIQSETKPSPRVNHAMAFDITTEKIILFGGTTEMGTPEERLNDTWEWNGSNWTPLNPATQPDPRDSHLMVYNDFIGKIIMFGGSGTTNCDGSSGAPCDGTWEWNGTNWVSLNPANKPTGGSGRVMVYDTLRKKIVYAGGNSGNCSVWEWDGTNWSTVTPNVDLEFKMLPAMAYDGAKNRIIMFGGFGDPPVKNETWEWNGRNWNLLNPATKPAARLGHSMVYDSARNRILMFGGQLEDNTYSDETWEWIDDNWVLRNPSTKPPGRVNHKMAVWPDLNLIIMFGGYNGSYNNETWMWNGSNWTPINPSEKPSARGAFSMTYHKPTNRIILFGGTNGTENYNNETWSWSESNWIRLYPASYPEARYGHSTVYDSSIGKTILFGGRLESNSSNATWHWDGTNWEEKLYYEKPLGRTAHTMVHNEDDGTTLIYGGFDDSLWTTQYYNDTWVLDSGGKQTPFQIMTAKFQSSGESLSDVSIKSLNVTINSGATGYPGPTCNAVNGAKLKIWDNIDGWKDVDTNSGSSSAPSSLNYEEEDYQLTKHFFSGSDSSINIAAVSSNESGCGSEPGSIATDYAEVTVKYRIVEPISVATWEYGNDNWSFESNWARQTTAGQDGDPGWMRFNYNPTLTDYSRELGMTSSIDISHFSEPSFNFYSLLNNYSTTGDEYLRLDCSGDGGNSWTENIWIWNNGTADHGWTLRSVTIPSECHTNNAMFRFRATGSSSWNLNHWGTDMVFIN